MKKDWLWDRKISLAKAKSILKNPAHPRFLPMSALLLLRKNTPAEVFKEYLSPVDFYQNWTGIKKIMQKDAWGAPRVDFWQAIFEKVRERLRKRGVKLKTVSLQKAAPFCKIVGQKIEALRKERGFTQEELAKKLDISQQIISRIESGWQNISLLTLKDIAGALKAKVKIELNF